MTTNQLIQFLTVAGLLASVTIGLYWLHAEMKRRTVRWKVRRFPRFSKEIEVFPRILLTWGHSDLSERDFRTAGLNMAFGWLCWNWLASVVVKTPRPWFDAKEYADNPGLLSATENKMDKAHERRVKKASKRALDRLRSSGVLK